MLFLLACGKGHTPPATSSTGADGASGASSASGSPELPEPAAADPNVTRQHSWQACGRIPATPSARGRTVHFGLDGTPVLGYGAVAGNAGVSATFGLDSTILLKVWPGDTPLGEIASGASCRNQRLELSSNAEHVMTYGEAGLCVFDVAARALRWRSDDAVASASFSANTVVVAKAPELDASGTEVSVYDLRGTLQRQITTAPLESRAVMSAWPTVAPDGSTLAALVWLENSYRAALWSIADGSLLWARPIEGGGEVVFSERSDFVLIGDTVFASATGEPVWTTRARYAPAKRTAEGPFVALAPDGQRIAAFVGEGLGVISSDGRLPSYLGAHSLDEYGAGAHLLRSLALSADGNTLVSVGREALRWELSDTFESSRPSYIGSAPYLSRVELDSAAHWAAFGGDGRSLYSLDAPESVYFPTPPTLLDDLCVWLQFRFSPDSRFLISTSWAREVEVYQTDQLLGFAHDRVEAVPVSQRSEGSCATLAFSRDGTQLQASDGALDATQLPSLNGSLPANAVRSPFDDIVDSPDGVDTIVSSGCAQVLDELGETQACLTVLHSSRFSDGFLPDLTAPFPSFSPEAHWVVAGPRLRHVPSGDGLELDPKARVSIFTPRGDIIVGERDGSLARYCLQP